MTPDETLPFLGATVRDAMTGITGTFIAHTLWHDRSGEAAIQRPGVDNDGHPWPIHWFPISRLEATE